MPRPEKVQAVADIKERLDGAQAVFLTEYAGLSVKEQQELRRELKANEAEMKVVKMTLARLAAEDMVDELTELLLGPTALTFAEGDPAAAAKALKAFSKDHDVLVIKGGVLGSEFLSPERISALADLPSRDVLLARVAGTLGAPMTQMAGLLAALPRNAATAFQQLLEKKDAEAPAEPEEGVAPESLPDMSKEDDVVASETTTEEAVDSDPEQVPHEGSWRGEGDPPGGYAIKGNEDSMLYHMPESSVYEQTIAEIWFDTEEAAQGAGYAKAATHPGSASTDSSESTEKEE